MKRDGAASLCCKSVFKSDSREERRAGFTQRMAQLINARERAKGICGAQGSPGGGEPL